MVSEQKRRYSASELLEMSKNIMRRLESKPLFKSAQVVLLFHSLPDEPCTHELVARVSWEKTVLLPVVINEDTLELREYRGENGMRSGAFEILEPQGEPFTDFARIDLAVIPGVAFDGAGNRLGRGRGYYDRLLQRLAPYGIPKIGVCFDFQRLPEIPSENHDIRVDDLV